MALPAPKPSIDTCNACGKLFPRVTMRLCTQCSLLEQNRFALVREYLLDNDGAPMGEIARETGVPTADVRNFCDGGRLVEVTSGMESCTCGGVGDRCRHCRSRLSSSFRDMEQSMRSERSEPQESGRTSYVRRIRRIDE